ILALTYAVECEPTNIKVNLINPGPMRTLMRKKAMPGEDPEFLVKPEEMVFKVVEMLSPGYTLNETIINFQK
ncbi:MAG: oxidoreductase, partial [Alphaproteobacteria bacterium]|nr:oxidoreductase [Alphaproteobacteria bacterium]